VREGIKKVEIKLFPNDTTSLNEMVKVSSIRLHKVTSYVGSVSGGYEKVELWTNLTTGRCKSRLIDFQFPLVGELLNYLHLTIKTENEQFASFLSFAGGKVKLVVVFTPEEKQRKLFAYADIDSTDAIKKIPQRIEYTITTKTLLKRVKNAAPNC
jgi:hypothetical protein